MSSLLIAGPTVFSTHSTETCLVTKAHYFKKIPTFWWYLFFKSGVICFFCCEINDNPAWLPLARLKHTCIKPGRFSMPLVDWPTHTLLFLLFPLRLIPLTLYYSISACKRLRHLINIELFHGLALPGPTSNHGWRD